MSPLKLTARATMATSHRGRVVSAESRKGEGRAHEPTRTNIFRARATDPPTVPPSLARAQSILCRNIAHSTSDADLRQLFERFGALRDVYTPKDFHTKRPKGFAFIEYVDERDAEDARAQVDGSMLDGRCVFSGWKRAWGGGDCREGASPPSRVSAPHSHPVPSRSLPVVFPPPPPPEQAAGGSVRTRASHGPRGDARARA